MASDKPVTDSFLAAIEAKIAAWTAVRDSYRAAVSIDGPLSDATVGLTGVAATGSVGRLQPSIDLPVGVFRDKSLKEAIPIYLGAGRRKQSNKDIAIGLKAGGFPTTAENFEATVATALYRLKNDGVVLRFSDGWDLAASYPDGLRNRLEKDVGPRKVRAKKAKRAKGTKAQASREPRIVTVKLRPIKLDAEAEENPKGTLKAVG